MSEEEREIDLELDGGFEENDDLRCDSGLGGQYDNKRALHNAMERKRRDSIKDSFKGLQDCIPTLRGDKTSRAQVLKKTGEYITHMQKKITDHQDEIKSLKNQNSSLESQIRALEKAKATGNYVNARAILEADSLVAGEDIDLNGLNSAEIIYDDTSSDASDSNSAGGAVKTVGGSNVMTVSLPSVPGVTVSLPTLSPVSVTSNVNNVNKVVSSNVVSNNVVNISTSVTNVNTIQPGQSLLTANRVQPGQSLLLSEPMRKKMKLSSSSLM